MIKWLHYNRLSSRFQLKIGNNPSADISCQILNYPHVMNLVSKTASPPTPEHKCWNTTGARQCPASIGQAKEQSSSSLSPQRRETIVMLPIGEIDCFTDPAVTGICCVLGASFEVPRIYTLILTIQAKLCFEGSFGLVNHAS